MTDIHEGQVVTFYSFKGGTGRTMALANVAWILAANGKRVLVADWDLESPGLHRFFGPFMNTDVIRGSAGIIDLIRDYEAQAMRQGERPRRWVGDIAKAGQHAFSIRWDFPGGGRLDFLSAGRQNADYAVTVGGLDWETFYNRLGGGEFFDALRADMKSNYDYALIDSRTGLSDIADICTIHLPDTLIACFTLSDQGIDGAAKVAHTVQTNYRHRNIRVLPVPMRIDEAEKSKAEAGLTLAMRRFAGLPAGMDEPDRQSYWAKAEVPYRAYYAYEEILAVFGDRPGSKTTLLAAYEALAAHITNGEVTNLPPMDETTRNRERARYERKPDSQDDEVALRYAAKDALWFEWIESLLASVGVRAVEAPRSTGAADIGRSAPTRTLTIVSPAYVEAVALGLLPPAHASETPSLAVYVAEMKPLMEFPLDSSAFLANTTDVVGAERILRLIGISAHLPENESPALGTRFPGKEPLVFRALARNPRFTGREDQIIQLRDQLRSRRAAVVLPVTLHGLGGVGKTQTALEYVYRFKSAYDIVWWIQADPPQFVDSALIDLADQAGLPGGTTTGDNARLVVQALTRGEPSDRWLLVFDNADDLEKVEQFLPQGRGHVIVTSRNRAWDKRGETISMDVFHRGESVSHLRGRVETMSNAQANRVAEALGDLPIAIAAAGALLAEAGTSISDYLTAIEEGGASTQSVDKVWDISLSELERQSPAAYRMFQLCSQMAAEIDLELLSSDAMADLLIPLNPGLSERLMRSTLIQDINRLALLKLDAQAGQIQVHRLVAAVVGQRMTQQERAQTRHDVHRVLAASRPAGDVDNPTNWPRFRMLWPHLTISKALTCSDENVRKLLIDRVRFLWYLGDLQQGDELGQEISNHWQELLDTDPGPAGRGVLQRQLLQLRFNLANILRFQARFDEARALDEMVLSDQALHLGSRHPHTLMTAGGLAADLRGQGQYAEALQRDLATYEVWSDVFGEDHPRTLSAANNVGVAHRLVGNFRAAREWDERVYERRGAVLGPSNPYTLHSASCLGRDHRDAGDYERSVALLTHTLKVIRDERGRETIEAFNAEANLAVSLRAAGRPEEAIKLLDRAYDWLEERLGPTNPDTLACRLSRAATLLALNRLELARADMHIIENSYRDGLGPEHPHTLVCVNNLAATMRSLDNLDEARHFANRAAERLAGVLGEDHPFTLGAETNVVVCLGDLENYADAKALSVSLLERLTDTLGADHPDTLRCQGNFALIAMREGTDASGEQVRALERLARAIGAEHPSVQALRANRLVHRVLDPHPF